jgi:Fe-S oxidoreductase
VGEEGLFETLRDKNLAAMEKARFRRIATGDPHTYHALKNEYGRPDGVVHYAALLEGWIDSGRLKLTHELDATATYHDPCYLGRYNGIYDAPRNVLAALGVTVVEMPRNRDSAYCCAAGGGRIWMEDAPASGERPAESRVREAAALGVRTLVVACPKDYVMFQDAIKTAGLEDRLSVRDLMELAEEGSRTDG